MVIFIDTMNVETKK